MCRGTVNWWTFSKIENEIHVEVLVQHMSHITVRYELQKIRKEHRDLYVEIRRLGKNIRRSQDVFKNMQKLEFFLHRRIVIEKEIKLLQAPKFDLY